MTSSLLLSRLRAWHVDGEEIFARLEGGSGSLCASGLTKTGGERTATRPPLLLLVGLLSRAPSGALRGKCSSALVSMGSVADC